MVTFFWETLSQFLWGFHKSNLPCNLVYIAFHKLSLYPSPWFLSCKMELIYFLKPARSSRILSDLENLFHCKQTSDTLSALCIKHKQHDDRKTTTKKGQNSDLWSVLPTDGRCWGALETFLICHTLDLAGMTTSGYGYFLWVLHSASSKKATHTNGVRVATAKGKKRAVVLVSAVTT